MHVRFQDTAEADLDTIFDYVSKQNERAATGVISSVVNLCYQLGAFLFLGREGGVDGTREISVQRRPLFHCLSAYRRISS